MRENETNIRLVKRSRGKDEIIAMQPLHANRCTLKVTAHEQDYSFYFSTDGLCQTLAENVDGRILSTPVAGGRSGDMLLTFSRYTESRV